MIIDGFFISQLTNELDLKLSGGRLEKIGQIDDQSFLFSYYKNSLKYKLVLNLYAHDYRLYITKKEVAANNHSQFLVSLKKHLDGAILKNVSQYLTDRVIIFDFIATDFIFGEQKVQLIFEAMGKHSNLILVKDDKMIDTYKKMFFDEGRQLLPQAKFEFFPSNKKTFDDIDYTLINSPEDITLIYMGVSKKLARYIYHEQLQIHQLPLNPTYDVTKNEFYATNIFDKDHETTSFDSLSQLMDAYKIVKTVSKSKYELFIDKQLKKLYQKDINLKEQLSKAIKQMDIKDNADLIYMSGVNLNEKTHELIVNDIKLLLDEHLTLNENAQKFYKIYQKAKRSIDPVNHQIEENNEQITLFEDFKTYLSISNPKDLVDFEQDLMPFGFNTNKQITVNKKHKKKPNILELSIGGIKYLIGKNSIQNAYVTHDLSQPNDYWFHVKDGAGSHVLVKTSELSESIIRTASMIAAYYSSLRYSSSIPVDYTQIKHIKKIPHKPGYQVIYKQFKTMFIDIDESFLTQFLHN